ncbi:MAG: FAD-binding oxidoreductase [Halolamina sp.]|jgi:ferredoxin-NADP reductase|uniref:FAD-binding oxidoreductase n=1 Tax=Halolamina sp. TaxID=1940283 RepID=UPI002FC3DAC9
MDTTVAVVDNESVGPDTYAITFESPEEFTGLPGQFVKISADIEGEGHARFYTLSSPDTEETFETTIEVDEEGGPFSAYLAGLSAGDEVAVDGPYGDEHYEGESRVVVVSGGPGVGPAVAISEAALADGNEAAVIYAHEGMPAHQARLNDVADTGASVEMVDAGDVEAFEAAVDEAVTGTDGEQLFVYGFAEFVAAAREAIAEAGGEPDTAKVENFG